MKTQLALIAGAALLLAGGSALAQSSSATGAPLAPAPNANPTQAPADASSGAMNPAMSGQSSMSGQTSMGQGPRVTQDTSDSSPTVPGASAYGADAASRSAPTAAPAPAATGTGYGGGAYTPGEAVTRAGERG